jgi:parvulin-like peptidyl-prolyl isomerase
MLERVRQAMQSGGTYVLVAFLIVIFAFFFGMPTNSCVSPGGPNQQQRRNMQLVDIAGESLSTNDLSILLNRFPDQNNQQNNQENQVSQQEKQALHTLVAIKVLSHLADKQGIYAGTQEFRDFMRNPIRNFEYLRVYGATGEWNGRLYQRYVQNQLGRRISEYEEFKHQELKARKLLGNAVMQAGLLPGEADLRHRIANTNINLELVAFDAKEIAKSLEVSESTVDSYLANQADRIKGYYDENKDSEFTTPKQLEITRVFIRKPGPNAGDSEKTKTNEKWAEAKRRVLDNGEAVPKVAEDLSDGKSEFGFRSVDDITSEVSNSLKDAEIGKIVDVETRFAYIIAKLEGRKDKKVTSFQDAKRNIARKLASRDQAKDQLKASKNALYKRAQDAASLTKALELLRSDQPDNAVWSALSVEETGDFKIEASQGGGLQAQLMGGAGGASSWGEIPKIGKHEKLAAIAFQKLDAENPLPDQKTFTVDKTDYLVRLKSKSGPDGDPGAEFMTTAERDRASELVGGPQGMRAQLLPGFLKGWQSIFALPQSKFGTWIDRQVERAVDNDVVSFNKKSTLAASVLNDIKPSAVQTEQEKKQKTKGAGSSGSPSIKKLKTGSGGEGGAPNIKLKQGSSSKSLKLNQGGGSSPSEGGSGSSAGESSGSSSSGSASEPAGESSPSTSE